MTVSLYNNSIQLEFDEVNHRYSLNGESIDGITSVLKILNKPKLIDWAVRKDMEYLQAKLMASRTWSKDEVNHLIQEASLQHIKIKEDSADFGSSIHRYLSNYIKGIEQEIPDDEYIKNRVRLFDEWAKENVSRFIDSERIVYSRKQNFCGTLDFTALLKDEIAIVIGDIKTSKSIYPEYRLQTAAYQAAFQEETGLNVSGRVIIRLGNDELEAQKLSDFKKDYDAFKGLLKVYRRINTLKL